MDIKSINKTSKNSLLSVTLGLAIMGCTYSEPQKVSLSKNILSISTRNINSVDSNGNSVLDFAIMYQKIDNVKYIIDHFPSSIKEKNKYGAYPIHFAAASGSPFLITLLINKGANVNSVNNEGYSPLMISLHDGTKKSVQALLLAGANPCAKNLDGHNSWYFAAQHGDEDAKELASLLEKFKSNCKNT